MIIHQAIYGPSRGHAYLGGSDSSKDEFFRGVAWLTDLPQTAPPGVTWAPFFRMVPFGECMLFIYTRPAEKALREGMVVSRLALLSSAQIEELSDLGSLAAILQTELKTDWPVEPIRLSPSPSIVHPPGILAKKIASAIERRRENPLVVLGQQGFDDALIELWGRVPREFRRQLTFGVSFGRDDVHNLNIVSTPIGLGQRWDPALCVDDSELALSAFGEMLVGADSCEPVRQFVRETGISLKSPVAVKLAVEAYGFWIAESTPPELIQLLRTLIEMGSSSPSAMAIKSQVVQRLAMAIGSWTARDVMVMRNLDLPTTSNPNLIVEAIETWVKGHLIKHGCDEVRGVLGAWAAKRASAYWLEAIQTGFESGIAEDAKSMLIAALWSALLAEPHLGARLVLLVSSIDYPEQVLLDAIPPSLKAPIVDALLPVFAGNKWWRLSGTALAVSRSAAEAFDEAIRSSPVDVPAQQAFVLAALSRVSAAEGVEIAIASENQAAVEIAAQLCVQSPSAFASFDWRNRMWFRLFEITASRCTGLEKHLPDPTIGLKKTVDARITDDVVWRVVANSSLANLIDVPGRDSAWSLIPADFVDTILYTTAAAWLERFEDNLAQPVDLEPLLEAEVRALVSARGYLTDVLRKNPAALPNYLSRFPFSNECDGSDFLSGVLAERLILSEASSRALGKMAEKNCWTSVAKKAAYALSHRADLRPMLSECIGQLYVIDQLWVGYRLGVSLYMSEEDAWGAFESEAVQMYPKGPFDRELWSRSGGRNEDLAHEDTGRTAWHRCIKSLRVGMAPGIRQLLNTMLEDYSHSDTLKQLLNMKFWR